MYFPGSSVDRLFANKYHVEVFFKQCLANPRGVTVEIFYKTVVVAVFVVRIPSIVGIVAIEAQSSGLLCLISDNIPIEADVVPELVTRLSIKQKPSNWIKNINRSKDRIKFNEVVKNSNYDINKVVDKLTEIYIKFHNRGDTDE